MSVDISRAWEISAKAPVEDHREDCSFRAYKGQLLCDCEVLLDHPEYKDKFLHTIGGVRTHKQPTTQSEIRLPGKSDCYTPAAEAFSKEVEDFLTEAYRRHKSKLSYDAMTLITCHTAIEKGVMGNLGQLE